MKGYVFPQSSKKYLTKETTPMYYPQHIKWTDVELRTIEVNYNVNLKIFKYMKLNWVYMAIESVKETKNLLKLHRRKKICQFFKIIF
jgi:hypothetical protein